MGDAQISNEQQEALSRLFESCPTEYMAAACWAKTITSAFQKGLAEKLAPLLNAHAAAQPQENLEDKRSLAVWVNGELRSLGLAIQCPKTGRPAVLVADFKDSQNPDVSRFRIEARRVPSHRIFSTSSSTLPPLALIPAPERIEPLSRLRKR